MMTRYPSEDYEGWCPEPVVYDKDTRESPVLDQHGRPFLMGRSIKIGFDLSKGDKHEKFL